MKEVAVLSLLLGIIIIPGILEFLFHQYRLRKIPVRIHVNGTRGKSSVTRLITAGMREAGFVVCGKTTGTLPRMILPDGSEMPVYRKSRPNVIEQIRIFRRAVNYGAEAVVLECMALQPYLQWLSEDKLVRATHGVITNARPDHLEVMGPDAHGVALALAGMTPSGGKLYTSETGQLDVLERAARDRNSHLVYVNPSGELPTDSEMGKFDYIEHKDNVALALRVCADLGINRETALAGMQKMAPDPGAMSAFIMEFFNRNIVFVNGFAANDPESTSSNWEMILKKYGGSVSRKIMLMNCRHDRPDRSRQLGESCSSWEQPDIYIVIGTGTHVFARHAVAGGVPVNRIVISEGEEEAAVFEKIIDYSGSSALVMGIGNIGANGLDIVRYFKNRSREDSLV